MKSSPTPPDSEPGPYGAFSQDGLEYVITDYRTPRPWANFLTNGSYCALISHLGGGYSFVNSSGYDRLTRFNTADALRRDEPGRFIYLRDQESGKFWRLTGVPRPGFSHWSCRHGLGRTTITLEQEGIFAAVTFFVPLDQDAEFWMVELENRSEVPRKLSAFSYVEWNLGDYVAGVLEPEFTKLFNVCRFQDGVILATKRLWNIPQPDGRPANLRWNKYAFMGSSLPAANWDCAVHPFLGPYATYDEPAAVVAGSCTGSDGTSRLSAAALQHNFELQPGQRQHLVIVLGTAEYPGEAAQLAHGLAQLDYAQRALAELGEWWKEYVSRLWVQTPDPDFDLSVNIWNKYQAWVISYWARMASYYIGGGSILGLRDTSQDLLGIFPLQASRARERLLDIMSHQFKDGGCLHNWDPITHTGPRTGHSDDPLWLILASAFYLKETGDLAFLDRQVPYTGSKKSGTVWEHLCAAIQHTLQYMSPRNIPLIRSGDWNDALSDVGEEGKGESVMVGQQLCWCLREMEELARRRSEKSLAEPFRRLRSDIEKALNLHCWDGEWYQRATNDEDQILGTSKAEYARIFLETQAWAVISGVADQKRAIQCLDSVRRRLDTSYGPALFLPAYPEPDPMLGIITRFAPGTKENGAIFHHAVSWAIVAECIAGRGDRAYELWAKTNFIKRGRHPDIYMAEPYVYSEFAYGPDHPRFGAAEFSWTTGSAPWMFRACLDYILGIRPELDGLVIDPCIPSAWPEFSVRRDFRDAAYLITVRNPHGAQHGVARIAVNGKPIEGTLLPVFADGKEHQVEVTMAQP